MPRTLDGLEQKVIFLFFVPPLDSSKADVGQVFDPLKIRYYPPSILINVKNTDHASFTQDGFGGKCHSPLTASAIILALIRAAFFWLMPPLLGCRDQDVALLFQKNFTVVKIFCSGISLNALVVKFMMKHILNIQPSRVQQSTIIF